MRGAEKKKDEKLGFQKIIITAHWHKNSLIEGNCNNFTLIFKHWCLKYYYKY